MKIITAGYQKQSIEFLPCASFWWGGGKHTELYLGWLVWVLVIRFKTNPNI